MNISYGFQATMTAHPGKSEELVELLLSGPTVGPASHEGCVVFLVSRSTSNPDVVHLTEGWVSDEVHETVFNAPSPRTTSPSRPSWSPTPSTPTTCRWAARPLSVRRSCRRPPDARRP